MPFVIRQKHGKGFRYAVHRKWPNDVAGKMPTKVFSHKFPVSFTHEMANDASQEVLDRLYWPKVFTARGTVDEHGIPLDTDERVQWYVTRLKAVADRINATNERVRMRFNAYRLGLPIAPEHKPVPFEKVIELWISDRTRAGHPPKSKAIVARRNKLLKMFDWLKKNMLFADGTDMAAVTVEHLQAYKEALPDNIVSDHFDDIKALFNTAMDNNKLPNGNPCDRIHVPVRKKGTRANFDDDEAAMILLVARESREPLIRWGHWLAAFTGTIHSEILGMTKAEIVCVDGVWVWDFTERQGLKTYARPRGIPLHPAVIREGFVDWVMTQPDDKPLFRVSPTRASKLLMESIRALGIKGKKKAHYSWRHRFATELQNLTTRDRARFLCGHAALDVHARHYLHHNLSDLVDAINALVDPTADQKSRAA